MLVLTKKKKDYSFPEEDEHIVLHEEGEGAFAEEFTVEYEHDFDIMFCVKTRESDPDKVTSSQLTEALLARLTRITLGDDGDIPKDSVLPIILDVAVSGCSPKGIHTRIHLWLDALRKHWLEGDAECRVEDMDIDSEMQESCGSQGSITKTASVRRDA
jgi:hypothetical protein